MADYAKTGFSRVFLIDGGASPAHAPSYQSCMKASGVAKGYGDITTIYCPSAAQYDNFDAVDSFKGAADRPTLTLTGRYLADTASELLRIAEQGCGADVQIHIGKCTDATAFNTFTKAVVMEEAYISNWSTGDLGALSPDDRATVDETAEISASRVYEIVVLSVAEVAGSIVTNEVVDVVICDQVACGECDETSTGCQHIYACTLGQGGSPGTPPDIVFTVDGASWYADDIDSLASGENPSAIGCVGDYVVVTSNAAGNLNYALKSEVNDVDYNETWTKVTTGFVGAPNDCWRATGGRYLYIVGNSGYVYRTDDPTNGVTALDAGVATVENLYAVHMLTDEFGVAVGNHGAVLYTQDGVSWSAIVGPSALADWRAVWCKSETCWLIGSDQGVLYYTIDKGASWATKGFSGSGSGSINDLAFATDAVGYLAHTTAAARGRIFRTYDGGYSWKIMPDGTGSMPLADRFNAIAACSVDPNFVVGVGLADNMSDGIVVIGSD